MDAFIDSLVEFMAEGDSPVGLAIIAASAALEYVLPPFPGDTITVFGAVLITAYDWSFWGVFAAVMGGSVAGSILAFWFGGWLQSRRLRRAQAGEPSDDKRAKRRALLDNLIAKFRRHGAAYLVVNRFFPGIRSLFFVAAGMAGIRLTAVVLYSAVSAAVWNLGLIALGSLAGGNFETLLGWVRHYTLVTWIVVAVVVVAIVVRTVVRRRRARRDVG